jgi:hypothetical protein
MANLLDMQKILGGIQQQYPVTPPTQPSASIPTPTANPTTGKNETLAMMLYALGGALKGDEDFVVKTLQFKEMQEGKKKEKEQKEAYDEFMKKLPDGSFKDLTKALGYKKLPDLLLERYKAEQPTTKKPTSYQEYALTTDNPTTQGYAAFLQSQEEAGATKIDYGQKGFQELGPKKYNERYEASQQASNSLTTVENLTNILDQGLQTGFGEQSKLALNRVGQFAFGQDFKPIEVASAEAFAAGTTQMILPLVKQLGVNPTDKDLDFVVKGSPELSKSVVGNRLMLKAVELSARRAQDEHTFDNEFYGKPENRGKTEVDRNIAFQAYKQTRPDLYSAAPLIQEYNNFLELQGQKALDGDDFTSTQGADLPPGL